MRGEGERRDHKGLVQLEILGSDGVKIDVRLVELSLRLPQHHLPSASSASSLRLSLCCPTPSHTPLETSPLQQQP